MAPPARLLVAVLLAAGLLALAPAANAAVPLYVQDWRMNQAGAFDVAFSPSGTLYASGSRGTNSGLHHEVQRFTGPTTTVTLLQGDSNPTGPSWRGMAIDGSNALYVANRGQAKITKLVEPSTLTDPWAAQDPAHPYDDPIHIAYSSSDSRMYVGDEAGGVRRVFILNAATGAFIKSFDGGAAGEPAFTLPQGIAVDSTSVYVADRNNHVIKVFDHEGVFQRKFGADQIGRPSGIALGPGGLLYVVDALNSQVDIFKTDGNYQESFGGPGNAPGSFGSPGGIAVHPTTGDVFVADSEIQQFSYNPGGGDPGGGDPGGGDPGGGNPGGGNQPPPTAGTLTGLVSRLPTGRNPERDEGAAVEACLADGRGCRLAFTDASGRYTFVGAVNGVWKLRAFPSPVRGYSRSSEVEGTVNGGTTTVDLGLPPLEKPKPGDKVESSPPSPSVDGTPVVRWDRPIQLSTYNCARGSVSAQIRVNGRAVRDVAMLPNPKNKDSVGNIEYKATTGPLVPLHGEGEVAYFKRCTDDDDQPSGGGAGFSIYIDPSGWVRTTKGAPIVGATVTLYQQDPAGVFQVVPDGSTVMSPSNRKNSDRTDIDGHFGWDVLTGRYKVRAEKAGCFKPGDKSVAFVESREMDIPPPVLDLDLRLDCPDKAGPKLSGLKLRKRVLTVKVGEAAKLNGVLESCVKRGKKLSCKKVRTFKASPQWAQTLSFTIPGSVKAGRYRATFTATDLAKNRSKPLRKTLAVG